MEQLNKETKMKDQLHNWFMNDEKINKLMDILYSIDVMPSALTKEAMIDLYLGEDDWIDISESVHCHPSFNRNMEYWLDTTLIYNVPAEEDKRGKIDLNDENQYNRIYACQQQSLFNYVLSTISYNYYDYIQPLMTSDETKSYGTK